MVMRELKRDSGMPEFSFAVMANVGFKTLPSGTRMAERS
jgi:hypothetical protein